MRARLAAGLVIIAGTLAALRQPLSEESLALDRWYLAKLQTGGLPSVFGSETFTARGEPTGCTGWLGAVLTGLWASLSPAAVSIVSAICCMCALALLYALCERYGTAQALCALSVAAVASLDGFATGTLGYELIVALAFAALLRAPDRNRSLWCIPLAIVWCNIGASGLLAGPLALAAAFGAAIDGRGTSPQLRRLTAIAFGSLGAALCTPGGVAYASQALSHLGLFDEKIEALTVWNPTSRPRALFFGFVPLLVASAWIGWRRTHKTGDILIAAVLTLAALANVAFLPIAAIVIALIAADASKELDLSQLDAYAGGRAVVPWGVAFAAIAVAVTAAVRPPVQDRGIAQNVRALTGEGATRLFCSVPSWCDFALGTPIAVYIDGRVSAYPAATRERAAAISGGAKSWRDTFDRLKVDAVITPDDRPLASLLDIDPHWRRIPSQGSAALFVRNA